MKHYEITITLFLEANDPDDAEDRAAEILDNCEFNYREDAESLSIKEIF